MDILTASTLIKKRELSPVDLVKKSLDVIAEENPKINALITVSDKAIQSAKELESELMSGNNRGALHGIPIAVKDLIFTKKMRTTMGSKVYENYLPDIDATVVKKLEDAGAIIIGKANTHEFAYGPIGDRSYFGACRNPHNPDKISGGSSSGSAAAVAAGMVSGTLGTDTGGSIRVPSSACGVVGMKPTFGLVSKKGVFDLAYTLDHIGPITTNIKDNALLLNILAGFDPEDPYSIRSERKDYSALIGQDIKGKVIGIPSFYFQQVDEEIQAAISKCIALFERLQVEIKKIDLNCMDEIAWAQAITIQSEAAAVHVKTMQKYKDDIDTEVYERLAASREVKGYEYVESQMKRSRLIDEYNQSFHDVDILLAPTLPMLPTDIGQREVLINNEKEGVRHALLRLTSPTNYTGNPSLSIPCGWSKSNLPIGVQLISKHGNESELYQFGYALEQSLKPSRK
ncbi:Asp-tRNA(Asn)/Glu-tRNA(Gln) amidotransferase GatCAB subunit A [Domibacillus epiphyticus]|uniref:Glutamyl-tRNA amidotransferase n=1 Tax=Domibacillus epiphyticus TaxID=1714355 RepID=A0A1V2A6D1_9BACI|nr:Asp-tRNA(Asn)/Glu-tRNA(Gln) amidotransferase GatCAB subunit A [Domibacillus epiphyticus]OMP66487.1 glutamyl-tRNA amidotransferase [Domibacillus epiphyticus]